MKNITSYWIDKNSALRFYFDTNGNMETKLYSKSYPKGKSVKGWYYEKVGFGLKTGYDKVSKEKFEEVISKY